MPTRFTRFAGLALVISSVLWLIGVGLVYVADVANRFPTSTGISNTRSPDTPRKRLTNSA